MGQKVNPRSFRLGFIETWDSSWYADKDYAEKLHQDIKIRSLVKANLYSAGVSKVIIERPANKVNVYVHASRPGIAIGKKGADIAKIKDEISKMIDNDVSINIVEVKKAEIDPVLVAQNIAQQLEKRVSYRKAVKRSIQSAMRMGAKGVRISVSGRLAGAEIARTEWYKEGRIPLHTLRAVIKYGFAEARTTYGVIGVKVWVYVDEDKNINTKETKNI